ncbi:MAG: 50S ribosomal protein L30 [Candidatus Marinimicrobia bacterium]|nr:50S ribosomal protein L30 [Candidatus Neomarinimicrobiota bacterium]
MADKKLKITQFKSAIGYRKRTKATIEALGLKKLNHSVIHNDSPAIRGMINAVCFLVKVEEV